MTHYGACNRSNSLVVKFTALHEETPRVTISDSKSNSRRNSVSLLNVSADDL